MWIQWHVFTECTFEYWLSWCVHSVCSHAQRENMVQTVHTTVRAWTEQRVILWMELALAHRVGQDLIALLGLVLMDCLGQKACQYVSATLITQTCESCHVIFVLHGGLSAHSLYCMPYVLFNILNRRSPVPLTVCPVRILFVRVKTCFNKVVWKCKYIIPMEYPTVPETVSAHVHSRYLTVSWTCPWRALLSTLDRKSVV
jgi:hypothetical protein